jgi:hypothetical protein
LLSLLLLTTFTAVGLGVVVTRRARQKVRFHLLRGGSPFRQ